MSVGDREVGVATAGITLVLLSQALSVWAHSARVQAAFLHEGGDDGDGTLGRIPTARSLLEDRRGDLLR
jgi:hypothetical protein